MAKILYGVAGEGMGHAVRSKVLIEHLQKKNQVKVVAASKSYTYLSKFFSVEEIDYFKIIYRNNKVANLLTFLNNAIRFPIILKKAFKVGKIIKQFKPDIIITDFEPITDYYAWIKKIPVISIDNQHIITSANYSNITKYHKLSSFLTKFVIKTFIIKANKIFIFSFLPAKEAGKDVHIIKPILRANIMKLKPKEKGYILVYQTSTSNKGLIPTLNKIKRQKFIVYGLYKNKKCKNVIIKDIKEKEFIKDLKNCKAVITNGGFTLISEALYLKKPILSIPVEKQFEQILNATHLDMMQYGRYVKKTTKENIEEFIKHIPYYKKHLQKYKKYTNKEALNLLDKTIKSIKIEKNK